MKNSIKLIALAAAALGATAYAGETDVFCKLNQAQSEVQSKLMRSAEVFTNLGDPVKGNETVITGVRKSLSRHRQGALMDELAAAQCKAYALDTKLHDQLLQVEKRGELLSARTMVAGIKQALELAEANVRKEEELLAVQLGRLADLQAAFNQAEALRGHLAVLMQAESRLAETVTHDEVSLQDLVSDSVSAQAQVAELTSKIANQSAWDVSISAGMRNNLRSNGERNEPFVTVNATYNLGNSASTAATRQVAALTEQLLTEKREGSVQGLSRAVNTVQGLIAAEKLTMGGFKQRLALVTDTLSRVENVNTTEGERVARALRVDRASTQAQLDASQARNSYLQAWLAINTK